jgi:hypothetical protein
MGGQPWLELELHGRAAMAGAMGTHQRGERRGKEEGDGGNDWGCGLRSGAPWEGRRSSALLLQLLSVSGGALALCM